MGEEVYYGDLKKLTPTKKKDAYSRLIEIIEDKNFSINGQEIFIDGSFELKSNLIMRNNPNHYREFSKGGCEFVRKVPDSSSHFGILYVPANISRCGAHKVVEYMYAPEMNID